MSRPFRKLMLVGPGLLAAWTSQPDGTAKASDRALPLANQRRLRTFANPVDLPYRYQAAGSAPFREAADPTIIVFRGEYWLFASRSRGYWHSRDLAGWSFVAPTGYPVDKYAPTVIEMGGRLYMTASDGEPKIWTTDDPARGLWTEAAAIPGYQDPSLFLDDDGRLYLYEGLSPSDGIHAIELDPGSFRQLSKLTVKETRDRATRGWEVPGDRNDLDRAPTFVEGAFMSRYRGRYYLQYAAPGTEYKGYADGVVVSDKALGPFDYAPSNPFSMKSTGFATGAGHGSTFEDLEHRWWHAATITISKRHPFERRIGLFPAYYTARGDLVADTYLGDYPRFPDGDRALTGWMLLSRGKAVRASSELGGFPRSAAVDEDIRTWWSAATGMPGETFEIDLGASDRIEAVQINFADQDSTGAGARNDGYGYLLELSNDRRSWWTAVDRSKGWRDAPHDYEVLSRPQRARYVRLTNVHTPDNGKFSLYDLRVFGYGNGRRPGVVTGIVAKRDADGRKARISWKAARDARFYVVRIAARPGCPFQNFQVYDGSTSFDVGSLTKAQRYYVTVDAVNERGIAAGRSTTILD